MASYLLHSKMASSWHLLTAITAAQHWHQSMQHLQQKSGVSRKNMTRFVVFWKMMEQDGGILHGGANGIISIFIKCFSKDCSPCMLQTAACHGIRQKQVCGHEHKRNCAGAHVNLIRNSVSVQWCKHAITSTSHPLCSTNNTTLNSFNSFNGKKREILKTHTCRQVFLVPGSTCPAPPATRAVRALWSVSEGV